MTVNSKGKPLKPWSAQYFAVIAEIDACYFVLEQMQKMFAGRDPIEKMIDESTGYEAAQIEEAKAIVDRIKVLQGMLSPDDPHFIKATPSPTPVEKAKEA